MMEKGSEYLGKGRSNGTKSPSNASNGHFSEESGSDDEHGEGASNTRLWLHRGAPALTFMIIIIYYIITTTCVCVCVCFQMWGCGSERTTRPTSPSSSPVSVCDRTDGGSLGHTEGGLKLINTEEDTLIYLLNVIFNKVRSISLHWDMIYCH